MPFGFNFKQFSIYAVYAAGAVFMNLALGGAPLAFGLCSAMLMCGTNLIATPVLFVLSSAVNLDLTLSLVALFEGAFMTAIVFLYRRSQRKMRAEIAVFMLIALAPYVLFAPWQGAEFAGLNPYVIKTVAAIISAAFTYFAYKCVFALFFRLMKCRLKEDELFSIAITCIAAGAGIYATAGQAVYVCLATAGIIFFARLLRSPSCIIAALAAAVPHAAEELTIEPIAAYVIISTLCLALSNAGRFAPSVAGGGLAAGYSYLIGCYKTSIPLIAAYAVLLALCALMPAIPRTKKLQELKRKLLLEEVLPDTAVERSRRRTGEKLYRISELFREIECAFNALDEQVDENAAKERMFLQLKESCCKGCERAARCEKSGVYAGFKKLIDAGCVKGKVNLIDLPSSLTAACAKPSDVLDALNRILIEYRRYMTEYENASSGRKLLADQAKGVAEVMKSFAVELNRTYSGGREIAENIKSALAVSGISCPEAGFDGESGEAYAVICGQTDARKIARIVSNAAGAKFSVRDKLDCGGGKFCLVLGTPPKYDAAFGVAYAVKNGGNVSGDTHSVIRISPHSFLMALSDGMGSGEYAHKVSKTAISLIEAFYRADMPEETILKTINKLLSFNRDERFACIDIAAVNLNSGRADFVKIGSPAGVIMREGEIKVLESASLPLGILDNLRPATCTQTLKSGDIIVFMSDGVSGAFPSSTELYEFLGTFRPLNPQNLADKILAGALERCGHVAADDMTVVCTRIFENEK